MQEQQIGLLDNKSEIVWTELRKKRAAEEAKQQKLAQNIQETAAEEKRKRELARRIKDVQNELGLKQATHEALEKVELGSKSVLSINMALIFAFVSKIKWLGKALDGIKGAVGPLMFTIAGFLDFVEGVFSAYKFGRASNKNSEVTGNLVVSVAKGILAPVAVGLALAGLALAAHIIFPIALGFVFGHQVYQFGKSIREWNKLKHAPDTVENRLIKAQVRKDIRNSIIGMVVLGIAITGVIVALAIPGVAVAAVAVAAIATSVALVASLGYFLYNRFKKQPTLQQQIVDAEAGLENTHEQAAGLQHGRKNERVYDGYYRNTFTAIAMPRITAENKLDQTVSVIKEIMQQIEKLKDDIKNDEGSFKEKLEILSEKQKRMDKIDALEKLASMTYLSLHPEDQKTVLPKLSDTGFAGIQDKAQKDFLDMDRAGACRLLEYNMSNTKANQSYDVGTSRTKALFEKARNIITAKVDSVEVGVESVKMRNAQLLQEVQKGDVVRSYSLAA